MRSFLILAVALVTIAGPVAEVAAGEAGDAGALFLRIGMGGRASGMGDAFTGVAKDASSVYWNPGAMAAVLGTNAMFMHNEYFQSVRLEQAAITHETDYGTLGIGFAGLYMDDIDRYDNVPSAIPLGTFSAYDVAVTLGFSRYIIPNLSAGVSGKYIFENIDETTAKGFAVDFGLYHISRIPGVKLAAVFTNLGPPMKFEDDRFTGAEFSLPRTAKIGGSLERELPSLRGDLLVTLDVLFPNDSGVKQHLGVEYGYDRTVFFRGGLKGGYDSQGATFGAGIYYRKFLVDYALQLISNDLGDTHRLSLSLRI